MHVTSSLFVKSLTDAKEAPRGKPAFAMIGRSNVGKSSLINALLGRKNLARTSSVPGKTELINYFLVNDKWFLVDLPGYGWAQTSKESRRRWEQMVKTFLAQASLERIFVLLDGRHPLQAIDMACMAWLLERQLPCALVLTKTDKCKRREVHAHLQALEGALHARKWPLPPFFVTSAKERRGMEEIRQYIETLMGGGDGGGVV